MLKKQQLFTVWRGVFVLGFIATFLTGCSDPYAAKLPMDARLTPGEVEKIAAALEAPDQSVFRRWADRHAKGEAFGGEGSAPTVKIALLNQVILDARRESELGAAKAKQAQDEQVARQKEEEARQQRAQLDQMAEKRREVDTEIRKHFVARAIGYELRPLFNRNGVEFAREWVFKLKLTSKSAKVITGAAGWATISDVFNANLGSYPLRIEPRLNPGQTIDYFVVMDYDRNEPNHVSMRATENLRITWFFESVAFSDGTNLDFNALEEAPTPGLPSKTSAKKGVEL